MTHSQRGTALPEAAIVMALLLTLMFGIIDFGRAIYTYSFVAQLAREGARWAIVRGTGCTLLSDCDATQAELQTYVRSLSEGATDPNLIAATSALASGCSVPASGCTIAVTVSYPFRFMLPFLPSAGITMASTSQMVISQ